MLLNASGIINKKFVYTIFWIMEVFLVPLYSGTLGSKMMLHGFFLKLQLQLLFLYASGFFICLVILL